MEEDSEESSDPESEKGVRIQLKNEDKISTMGQSLEEAEKMRVEVKKIASDADAAKDKAVE